MHLIFRPLLILLTLTALVFASLQVGGRVLMWLLDDLEVAANQWLWSQGIEVSGLQGEWHQLNPVIRIGRIDLPAGHVEGVYVEIGLLETLWRSTPVARQFAIEQGQIDFEHSDTGWRFRGGLGSFDFDLSDLVYHSDGIDIASRLGFSSAAGSGSLDVHYRAMNRVGMHRHRLELSNPDQSCADDCALRLAFDGNDSVALVRTATQAITASSRGLVLPAALARVGSPRLDELDLRWRLDADVAGGVATVSVSGLELAPDKAFNGGLMVQTRASETGHLAQVSGLYLSGTEEEIKLPVILLDLTDGLTSWWTQELDLGELLGFFSTRLPEGSPGERWLTGLQLRGQARNLRGYIDSGSGELGYAATLQRIDLESFGGAPYMRGGGGELVGFNRGMQIRLNAENMDTHWRAQFADNWMMGYAQGILQAWFGKGYFAMRGLGMRLSVGDSHASGGFAINRVPGQPEHDRLTLIVNADQASIEDAKQFVPIRLPAGLPEWIERGPRAGLLENIRFAYHGQIIVQPFELARRLEMSADITGGHVQYHPDWPEMFGLDGFIEVAAKDVRFAVDRGTSSYGSTLDGTRLLLADNAAYAELVLSTETTVDAALTFIRSTPLKDWMSFITPDWRGEGAITLDGTLHIPLSLRAEHIGETSLENEFAARLEIGLNDTDLSLDDYRVDLEALSGLVSYEYPSRIAASNVRGRILDQPAVFGARSDDDTVIFSIVGQAAYTDVLEVLDIADPGILQGGFDYLADLHIELGDEVPRLEVVSDLAGLALALPGELGKQPEDSVATAVELRFLEDYQALNFGYGNAQGWLHVADGLQRGAIGFGEPAPTINSSVSELVLSGQVSGFRLDEVIPDGDGESALALPIRLDDLVAEHIALEDLRFSDVLLNGTIAPGSLALVFESQSAQGEVSYIDDEPMQIHLTHLRLPDTSPAGEAPENEEAPDPLDPSVIADLPLADVTVDQFNVGEADYGAWSLSLVPDDQGVALRDLKANLRGVAIASDEVYWQAEPNQTRFEGTLAMADLEKVLPLWDIVPSLSTSSAQFSGDLHWRGSPANVDVDRLIGPATFVAKDGRFMEVDAGGQGALKIFSLVNFSTVLKRLNLDFSDVRGKGISFEEIRAETYFDEGRLIFTPEPIKIIGSGSEFKIAGEVNLLEGTLDNEMIVTLPVTRSLPWYAAYIALANPLTAIGVIVGERMLRKPIEQFSSAKYTITGPIENPELTFVNVWDRSVDKPHDIVETPSAELPVPADLPSELPEDLPLQPDQEDPQQEDS